MFGDLEKRLLLSVTMLAWLCYLSYQAFQLLGGRLPAPPEVISNSPVGIQVHRVRDVEEPFALALMANMKPAKNLSNPFYPNPTQPAPPLDPPHTRTIELTYQGFFSTSQGEKKAYLLIGDQIVIGGIGVKVVANWSIANISVSAVTLQDSAGKKLVLDFKVKKPVTIPLS